MIFCDVWLSAAFDMGEYFGYDAMWRGRWTTVRCLKKVARQARQPTEKEQLLASLASMAKQKIKRWPVA